MSAKIECFRGSDWSARAAAMSAVERLKDAPVGTQFVALWIEKDEDGGQIVSWSKNALTASGAAYMAAYMNEFMRHIIDQQIQRQCE